MLSQETIAAILDFRRERDWEQFHNARTLAAALSVEAAELLEHFVWARDEQVSDIVAAKGDRIEQELADVAILLTYLANEMNVDLDAAVSRKLTTNAQKYPVAKSKGRNTKYTDL